MPSNIGSEVEKKFGISSGELMAVIYYRNRLWTHATVYGSKAVGAFVAKETPMGTTKVTQKKMGSLKTVPAEGIVQDGITYGLKSGKVLLVSGDPP